MNVEVEVEARQITIKDARTKKTLVVIGGRQALFGLAQAVFAALKAGE